MRTCHHHHLQHQLGHPLSLPLTQPSLDLQTQSTAYLQLCGHIGGTFHSGPLHSQYQHSHMMLNWYSARGMTRLKYQGRVTCNQRCEKRDSGQVGTRNIFCESLPWKHEFDSVAAELVNKHPCLKEPGGGTGYAGWTTSIKYKMGNYRSKLRQAGCNEVGVNRRSRREEVDDHGVNRRRRDDDDGMVVRREGFPWKNQNEVRSTMYQIILKATLRMTWKTWGLPWLKPWKRKTRTWSSSNRRWTSHSPLGEWRL